MSDIMIWAHRGASGDAPENTMAAFELAVEQGAHGIELDVHLSRDGQVVVAHDERVDRVSDGTGAIAAMTLEQLRALNFSKVIPGFRETKIPTLLEVFRRMADTNLWVNVELKTNIEAYPGIEEKCIRLARETGMEKRLLFSSFNHHSLLRIKRIDPSIPCGILYDNIMVRPWEYAKVLGFEALHPHYFELRVPGEVEESRVAGIRINTWTVNEESDLREVAARGPHGIITNYPRRALEVIGR